MTYECAMVPVTGIPNRKPAWTLLVRSKPEGQVPPSVCVCVCVCVCVRLQQPFTSDVCVAGGGEPPVWSLGPPQPHLQQLPLWASGHTETRGVAADQTEEHNQEGVPWVSGNRATRFPQDQGPRWCPTPNLLIWFVWKSQR